MLYLAPSVFPTASFHHLPPHSSNPFSLCQFPLPSSVFLRGFVEYSPSSWKDIFWSSFSSFSSSPPAWHLLPLRPFPLLYLILVTGDQVLLEFHCSVPASWTLPTPPPSTQDNSLSPNLNLIVHRKTRSLQILSSFRNKKTANGTDLAFNRTWDLNHRAWLYP